MKLVKELPEIFEEFGEQRRKSFLEIKEYKEKGIPVIGMYCAYFPSELAMAIGAIPVGLCSFSQETVIDAEKILPKNMCPLVKSSYGFAIKDKCPFFHFADLVIGETTCDGKKKMYEMLAEMKPVFVMDLPNTQSKEALIYWKKEIIRTKEYIEDFFHVAISDEDMKEAIHLGNEIRKSLKKLCSVMKLDPAPIFGMDIQKMVIGSKYRFDFQNTPQIVDSVTERILSEYEEGKMLERRPRILITGCPIGGDSLKIVNAIEDNGGVVVAFENCSGVKSLNRMIDEDNPDIYGAIAEKYLSTGCSIMTPNDNRVDLIGEIIDEYSVDGVVEVILSGCHSTSMESIYIQKFVREEKKIPYLALDTDYSPEDYGQICTRVSALLEMIAMEKTETKQIDITKCYKIMFSCLTKGDTISEILDNLWQFTEIPMVILNAGNQAVACAGVGNEGEWEQFSHPVQIHMKDGGRIIGNSPSMQMSAKLEELLQSVEKIYTLRMKKSSNQRSSENTPDFLWVILENPEENVDFADYVRGEAFSFSKLAGNACQKLFFSNLEGIEDRNKIIDGCRKYAKDTNTRIVIGNGFAKAEQADSNRKMMERLYQIVCGKDLRQRVYLIEDHYQELAVDYVKDKVEEESFRLEELELLKKEDSEKESFLYETLYWYLLMKRNTAQTAARLGIHRNTLLHRISRINELLQLDERDGAECERLLTAMQLERALKKE